MEKTDNIGWNRAGESTTALQTLLECELYNTISSNIEQSRSFDLDKTNH